MAKAKTISTVPSEEIEISELETIGAFEVDSATIVIKDTVTKVNMTLGQKKILQI